MNGAGVLRGARPFFLLLLAAPVSAGPVLERARAARLWEDPGWARLLHYKPGSFFGAPKGDALPGPFYASPDGRRDLRAELEALAASLEDDSPDPAPTKGEPAGPEPRRCRWPARAAWAAARLGLDPAPLLAPCRRFAAWKGLLAADGAALVFASAYVSNPSSMFGHTFLRLERRGGAEPLLDNTLNFAAETPEDNGVFFAVKGLLGLYPGKYAAMPYYMKAQEYGSIEHRDLWEYRLALTSAEVDALAAHAWEVGQAVFPYYFFSKNCSYQLMPLLEAAAPRLELMAGSPPVVAPSDTVLAALRVPGLVRETVYRPSHGTVLRQRRALLSAPERRAAWAYARGRADEADALASGLAPGRRALVLDAAQDLVLYEHGFSPDAPPAVRALERPILLRRGRLDAASPDLPRPRRAFPPDAGHLRRRLVVGAGARRGGPYAELGWRPGLHADGDAPPGFLPGNSIESFSWRLRYDAPTERVHLKELRVLDILSLTPFDPWTRKPSWALGTGLDTAVETGRAPADALVYSGHLGTGLTLGRPEGGAWLAALLPTGEFSVGEALRGGGRLGGSLRLVASADAGPLHAVLQGGLSGFVLGDRRPNHRLGASFDWSLGRDRSLRAEFAMRGPHREGQLAAVLYH